jgi:hypothetical protein
MNSEFYRHIFEKFSVIKFPEKPAGGMRAELFHEDGQPHMTKPIVAFRNFAEARDE